MILNADGTMTLISRFEFPEGMPETPISDIETTTLGQYKRTCDGSYKYAGLMYRQGNIPDIFQIPINSLPNYCFVVGGEFTIDKHGALTGTMKLGAGELNFALPNGPALYPTVHINSITLQKQDLFDLYSAIPYVP